MNTVNETLMTFTVTADLFDYCLLTIQLFFGEVWPLALP